MDTGSAVQQVSDGGYIITGTFGGAYLYLVRVDATGDTVWTRRFGASDRVYGESGDATSDGGYVAAGMVSGVRQRFDVYIVRTNPSGDLAWTKTYGGSDDDRARSVQQTVDGGYIVVGYTESFGAGSQDVYLLRLNAAGDTIWSKTYGGEGYDMGHSVKEVCGGGFVIAG